jgi:pimeloyl-ACP methyl ester carboxylesterase
MATLVLVHGGFVGGWAWRDAARGLREMGHDVYWPTLTGLGERAHLARPETDLDTHIQDVVNVLHYEDLRDVALVSWSYSGIVVTGVADRVPERLRHVIHIDGEVAEDGQSLFDLNPPEFRAFCEESARSDGNGWLVRLGDSAALEDMFRTRVSDADRRRWFIERITGQPIRTFAQPIRLTRGVATGFLQTFVRCSLDDVNTATYEPIVARLRALPGWECREIATSHGGPFTDPDLVARVLHDLVT